jgi:hypothetical protein
MLCKNKQMTSFTVPMVEETQKSFPLLRSCSFDKGFHSPSNQKDLKTLLDFVCLPKKGKLSKTDQELEYSEEFRQNRRKHSDQRIRHKRIRSSWFRYLS